MASKVYMKSISAIREGEGRKVIVFGECEVRGAIAIVLSEGDTRWLRADLVDKVNRWKQEDGDTD